MKTVGIFEAKTRLSEICEEVASSGHGVIITRRGKPLVRIEAVEKEGLSVWEARADYIARTGSMREEFQVPSRSRELPSSPLDD
jgi:prevent-host-death family protein